MQRKTVLYFTKDGTVRPEIKQQALTLREAGVIVQFRNAAQVQPDHKAEECDAVSSDSPETLPKQYAKHKSADDIIREAMEEQQKLKSLAGDVAPEEAVKKAAAVEKKDLPPESSPKDPPKGSGWKKN